MTCKVVKETTITPGMYYELIKEVTTRKRRGEKK